MFNSQYLSQMFFHLGSLKICESGNTITGVDLMVKNAFNDFLQDHTGWSHSDLGRQQDRELGIHSPTKRNRLHELMGCVRTIHRTVDLFNRLEPRIGTRLAFFEYLDSLIEQFNKLCMNDKRYTRIISSDGHSYHLMRGGIVMVFAFNGNQLTMSVYTQHMEVQPG